MVYARVLAQFTGCGSDTFPWSPSRSYTLRAACRIGPHCIGPRIAFLAVNDRNPSLRSSWSMCTHRVHDWNP